jgi:hypothetical protein
MMKENQSRQDDKVIIKLLTVLLKSENSLLLGTGDGRAGSMKTKEEIAKTIGLLYQRDNTVHELVKKIGFNRDKAAIEEIFKQTMALLE